MASFYVVDFFRCLSNLQGQSVKNCRSDLNLGKHNSEEGGKKKKELILLFSPIRGHEQVLKYRRRVSEIQCCFFLVRKVKLCISSQNTICFFEIKVLSFKVDYNSFLKATVICFPSQMHLDFFFLIVILQLENKLLTCRNCCGMFCSGMLKSNLRIIEEFRLKGALGVHLIQFPAQSRNQL